MANLTFYYSAMKGGKKARFNARLINDAYTVNGDEFVVDGAEDNVGYRPLCGKCFL